MFQLVAPQCITTADCPGFFDSYISNLGLQFTWPNNPTCKKIAHFPKKNLYKSFSLLLYLVSTTFTVGSEKELIENEEGNQEKKKSLCSRIVAGKLSNTQILCF